MMWKKILEVVRLQVLVVLVKKKAILSLLVI